MTTLTRLVIALGLAELARGVIFLGALPWIGGGAATGAMAVNLLAETLGKPVSGWLIDRFGWRVVLHAGFPLLVCGLLLAGISFGREPSALLAGAAMAGLAVGWIHLAALRGAQRADVGRIQAAWMIGVGVGFLGAPWLAGRGLGPLIWLSIAATVLGWLTATTVSTTEKVELRTVHADPATAWRLLLPILPLTLLQTGVIAALIAALPILGRAVWDFSPAEYNGALIAAALGCGVCLIARRLHNRAGRLAGILLLTAGLALLGTGLPMQLPALVLAGAGIGLFMPAWMRVVRQRIPEDGAGSAWALVGVMEGLAAAAGAAVAEWLLPAHPSMLLGGGAALYLVLALVHGLGLIAEPGGPHSPLTTPR